jgi:hypothetical protein
MFINATSVTFQLFLLEPINECSREQSVTMLVGLLLSCSTFATAALLWSSKSASWDTTNEAFLIGNGKLGGKLTY